MSASEHIVYVDESGDHSLTSVNPEYPVFVLAFCVFSKAEYSSVVTSMVTNFKFKYFGHDQVVLHERDIRQKTGPFRILNNQSLNQRFLEDLSSLMRDVPFTLIAAVVNKLLLSHHYSNPESPYDLALTFCMERLQMHLRPKAPVPIVVESRGKKEDAELELVFRRVCDGANHLNERLPHLDIVFASKQTNAPGLQVADLVARPIGRHVMQPEQPNQAWDILNPKFRRDKKGKVDGWGLKCFP